MKIPRCYDSHVHWEATGAMAFHLDLSLLNSPQEIHTMAADSKHFRGDWIVGFGWDDSQWPEPPTKEILDHWQPDKPVALSRCDGHCLWLNSKALQRVGLLEQEPSGLVKDPVHEEVLSQIPSLTFEQREVALRDGAKYFNSFGFTHIRDLGGAPEQWEVAQKLYQNKELFIYVDQFFEVTQQGEFEELLAQAKKVVQQTPKNSKMQIRGMKIYLDGALGSEGAWLSQYYPGTKHDGLPLLSEKRLKECLIQTWEAGLEFAVHAIGDAAAHQIAQAAKEVWSSFPEGRLHIEHAQVMRQETLNLFKNRPVVFHMQPCHWWSDRQWLKDKLGDLYSNAFPWTLLNSQGFQLQFGSDSPIATPGPWLNVEAIEDADKHGIPKPATFPWEAFSHPEYNWGGECYSYFEQGKVTEVIFDGKRLHHSSL